MNVEYCTTDRTAMQLLRAILIYGNSNHVGANAATIHDVQAGVIQPGRCVSRDSVMELSRALSQQELQGRKGGLSPFIPPELVALSEKVMAWYCPSQVRPTYFRTSNDKLDALDGKMVCNPNLFFVKGDGFKVFALADQGRPTSKTKLYQAPYFNVWSDHKVCLGDSKMPKANHPSLIHDCERGFFQSAFTHSNIAGTSLTAHKDGHLGLWQEMTKAQQFPAKYLNPLKLTVADVI